MSDWSSSSSTTPAQPGSARSERLLEGLNPQQRQAVLHRGGPLLIVAGAGSGKTSVLTRRIAYLLEVGGAHPGQILAITFTNKAAAEMRERVAELVGPEASRMWVATFHSICVRILRAQYQLVPGRNSNFTIYDGDDARRLLSIIAKEQGLDIKKFTPRYLANAISNHKNELVGPEQALAEAQQDGNRNAETIATVYVEYAARLRAANAFDFDDLIGEVVALLRNNPAVAEYYRRRFRHVLVDEYQDTNHAQYVLVRTIVGGAEGEGEPEYGVPPSELCVVGDADQSIYAFRGATIRNIEDFEKDFPDAESILLEQNYRSTQNILTAANAVISRNEGRRPKNLWTSSDDGSLITGYVADNEHDEARYIAGEIDRLVDSGGASYSDVAVFYRTNNSSRVLEDIFLRLGIPYKVVGGLRFYERKEVRDAVAYLRVLLNEEDAVSMRRILNTPRRGIGDKAEQAVVAHAEMRRIGFGTALREAGEGKVAGLGSRAVKAISAFVEMLDGLRARLHGAGHVAGEDSFPDIGEILDAILDDSGYRDALQGSNDPQDGTRLDNLEELVGVAREFSSEAALRRSVEADTGDAAGEDPGNDAGADPEAGTEVDAEADAEALELDAALDEGIAAPGSLEAFLERVSLVADADEIPADDAGEVTLMTLHTAKGLEFPV
ncbi:ATP-dependent helicase, partial [Dietzia sp.]|uniref:ATP-dependent helicase n=1 Tax=Dietzia sp. TaxID=1871616 RepID=UPI002FD98D7F